MNRKRRWTGWLVFILLVGTASIVSAWPPAWQGTDDEESHAATNFTVYYTDDCASYPNECITATRADVHGDHLDDAWNTFVSWGFNPPTEGGTVEAWVVDAADLSCGSTGCAKKYQNRVEVVRSQVRANATSIHTETPHHELMHREENTYAHEGTTWEREGSCSLVQDAVFADIDRDPASSYVRRVNSYLTNLPRLDQASYRSCLFFKYYIEQIGTSPATGPGENMNALVWFWENADADGDDWAEDVPTIIDRVLAARAPGMTYADLFHDFIVTNYVKGFINVSSRFRYQDEQGANGTPYDPVHVQYGREPLNATTALSHSGAELGPWGARYYVGQPDASCPFVEVDLDGDSGDHLAYTVLATRGTQTFFHGDDRYRTWNEDFQKTLYVDGYDEVVAVVGSGSFTTTHDVKMRCVTPDLEILWPTTRATAIVGDNLTPRHFILRLSVRSGGTFVDGLDQDAFDVSVGGDDAPVIDALYVQNQYWLVIDTPTQAADGDYDLAVSLDGGISDTEAESIQYEPRAHLDHVLLVDRSNSMAGPTGYPKLLAAQNAAKLYVDEAATDDQLGVISFAATPSDPPDFRLTLVRSTSRENAKQAIEDLSAGGTTSIGGALTAALDEFVARGDGDKPDYITLLSDGIETASPTYDAVRRAVIDSSVRVNAVALGSGTDEDLLQRIVSDTHGIHYFYAAVESATGVAPSATGNEWAYRLSGIYDYIEGQVAGRQRIAAHERQVTRLDQWVYAGQYLDSSVSHATFSVAYEQYTPLRGTCGLGREVRLIDPAGNADSTPTRSDGFHDIYVVTSPKSGLWQIAVRIYDTGPCQGSSSSLRPAALPYNHLVMISAQTDLAVELFFGTQAADRLVGSGIPILALVMDAKGLVPGAALQATVTGCDQTFDLTLKDDGQHGDGAAGDGLYGATFTQATCAGSYSVDLSARDGKAVRQATGAFYARSDRDSDGDGMPNRWEIRNRLNPKLDDADLDPDLDFLNNGAEYQLGTNPQDDDTDGGGELDWTELWEGQDAINDPDDDQLAVPTGFRAEPGNRLNVLRWNVDPTCDDVLLYSSPLPSMLGATKTQRVASNTGVYTDTGLPNGTTVYYKLSCRGPGHVSGYTNRVEATPRADTQPPEGTVTINDGAYSTAQLDVTLSLYASPDAVEMKLSNGPDFGGARWEPFASSKHWRLEGRLGEAAFVHVAYRDAAGNVSDEIGDGIMLQATDIYLPIVFNKLGF